MQKHVCPYALAEALCRAAELGGDAGLALEAAGLIDPTTGQPFEKEPRRVIVPDFPGTDEILAQTQIVDPEGEVVTSEEGRPRIVATGIGDPPVGSGSVIREPGSPGTLSCPSAWTGITMK